MPMHMIAIARLPVILLRIGIVIVSLGLWFWTQALLSRRITGPSASEGSGRIGDGIHRLTAKLNRDLQLHSRWANALLISSSLVIDVLGLWMIAISILGPTIQPFLGLMMLFALRQLCQAFCALPPPAGMIWRHPGFPALLVTYGTSEDLFFSGHTAMAVFGSICLATAFGPIGIVAGTTIALFEMSAVLVLRAHYTMDVFAGAVTAMWVYNVAWHLAPTIDRLLSLH
jgi:PAP2 superfamily C-terminal